jgi:putative Mg2+ transporter-C (MgtC) family protein
MNDFALSTITGLVLALLLGTVIGVERRLRHHAAGLHTHALVALGSAAFMVAAMSGSSDSPARMMAQITTGVGFLCGGVIMHQGATVRGLNTAATIWCSAAVGVLAGAGLYGMAIAAASLVLLANILLHWLEHGPIPWPKGNDVD